MSEQVFILADSTGAIVSIVFFVVLWIVGQIAASIEAGKKKRQQEQGTLPPADEYSSGPVIIIDEVPMRRPPPVTKQKKRRAVTPQPPVAIPIAPKPEPEQEYTTESAAQRQSAETVVTGKPQLTDAARNVRMMLQSSGIREAMILNEVLGKPKGLRDE